MDLIDIRFIIITKSYYFIDDAISNFCMHLHGDLVCLILMSEYDFSLALVVGHL